MFDQLATDPGAFDIILWTILFTLCGWGILEFFLPTDDAGHRSVEQPED